LARQEGIEPPTHSLEGCCSIQLSYWRVTKRKLAIEATRINSSRGVSPISQRDRVSSIAAGRKTLGQHSL
jgi:hypothetical protein